MPLGVFEEEIDLSAWTNLADYDFEEGWKERNHQQLDLSQEGAAEIADGKLDVRAIENGVTVELQRESEEPQQALALNLRMRVDDYLGVEGIENPLLALIVGGKASVVLAEPRWAPGQPDLYLGSGLALAPPGKIPSKVEPGRWHELWLVMDGESYRIWIDDQPLYHASAAGLPRDWKRWLGGNSELWVGGFQGSVDHIRILEK